jgi:hypothetical protein
MTYRLIHEDSVQVLRIIRGQRRSLSARQIRDAELN